MSTRRPSNCSRCQKLQQENRELGERVCHLEQALQQLREQLAKEQKNSSTSAKPPSSDIVKPPKPLGAADTPQRKIGGQPGHPPHFRAPFPAEQVTNTVPHHLLCCPDCGQALEATAEPPRLVQQVDLEEIRLTIVEHRSHTSWCSHCQKAYKAPLPAHIEQGGLLGPQLTALVAYLKGACHASFSTIRKFFRAVLQIPISRGYLVKVIAKVSAALDQSYEELLRLLPSAAILNVDETGHKFKGDRWWTWCFRAELYVLYHIDAHRSGDVLMQLLGKDFQGVIGCDYFSSYRRYMRECGVTLQFCLAHWIRDVKFLTTLPRPAERAYGERLRTLLRELFAIIHEREQWSATAFRQRLAAKRREILAAGLQEVPDSKHGRAMANRFRKHGTAYFEFITTPGIEPTNNLAEQAIRFVVIDRHITQGTRSESGNRWCERIWTVIATCALQGKSVYEFLTASVTAYWAGTKLPSLVPE
jgi:transposase